jgi:hypothetical protein
MIVNMRFKIAVADYLTPEHVDRLIGEFVGGAINYYAGGLRRGRQPRRIFKQSIYVLSYQWSPRPRPEIPTRILSIKIKMEVDDDLYAGEIDDLTRDFVQCGIDDYAGRRRPGHKISRPRIIVHSHAWGPRHSD